MHELVQSAIEAAKQGNNDLAMDLIRQVLSANPKDVDGWLVLAAVVDQAERKRECLERVLSLDPTNQIARDEMLEIDREAMGGGFPSDQETEFNSEPQSSGSQSSYSSNSQSPESPPPPPRAGSKAVAQTRPPANVPGAEKPLVFKYPIWMRLLIYFFIALSGILGTILIIQNPIAGLPVLGIFFLALLSGWAISPKVELNGVGIRVSQILGGSQVGWKEIRRIKSSAMKQYLELITDRNRSIKISSQLSDYPRIVEILRQKRPDLFGIGAPVNQQMTKSGDYTAVPAPVYGDPKPGSSFTGIKVLKKSLIAQYGSYIITIPMFLISVLTLFTNERNLVGAGLMAAACLYMMISPLFQISEVKVEPNRMTIEKAFEENEYSAGQIASISMKTIRGRYGHAHNYVHIQPASGKAFTLQGFSEGDELIYGFLMNWWNSYRNK